MCRIINIRTDYTEISKELIVAKFQLKIILITHLALICLYLELQNCNKVYVNNIFPHWQPSQNIQEKQNN